MFKCKWFLVENLYTILDLSKWEHADAKNATSGPPFVKLRNTFDILNWVDLSTRRQINKCVLVFKCLNNLVPKYLSGYFVRNSNIHSYNTRRKDDLHLPKPNLSLQEIFYILGITAL